MPRRKDTQYIKKAAEALLQLGTAEEDDSTTSPMEVDISSVRTTDSSALPLMCCHDACQQQQSSPSTSPKHHRLPSFSSLLAGHMSTSPSETYTPYSMPPPPPYYSNSTESTTPSAVYQRHLPSYNYTNLNVPHKDPYVTLHPPVRLPLTYDSACSPSYSPCSPPSFNATSSASSVKPPCPTLSMTHHTMINTPAAPFPTAVPTVSATSPMTRTTRNTSMTGSLNEGTRRARKARYLSRTGSLSADDKKWSSSIGRASISGTSFKPYQHPPPHQYQHHHHHHHHRFLQSQQQEQRNQQQHEKQEEEPTDQEKQGRDQQSVSDGSSPEGSSSLSATTSPTSIVKPRWQENERRTLLMAIVKEKQLDDMTSFSWDRISLAVGRAKKACKDQWRREVLPTLMDRLK